MLATAHTSVALVLASITPNISLAVAAGAASHLLLDRVPHWGRVSRRTWKTVAVIDGLTAGALATAAYVRAPEANRGRIVASVIGANLPDIDKPVHFFTGHHLLPLRARRILERGQREAPHRIAVDAVVSLTALCVAHALTSHKN